MCYRVVERYSLCRCHYYGHSINLCLFHGQRGHAIQEKTIVVGESCSSHCAPMNDLSDAAVSYPRSENVGAQVNETVPVTELDTSAGSGLGGKHDAKPTLSIPSKSLKHPTTNTARPFTPKHTDARNSVNQYRSFDPMQSDVDPSGVNLTKGVLTTSPHGEGESLGVLRTDLNCTEVASPTFTISTTTTTEDNHHAPSTKNRPTQENGLHGQGKKRARQASEDGNGLGNGSQEGSSGEVSKRKKDNTTDDKGLRRRLRCPFYLRNPRKYSALQACSSGMGFEGMSRLRYHLKRVHTQPLRCPCCQQEMSSKMLLKKHLRDGGPCEVLPEPADDRICQEKWEKIDCMRGFKSGHMSVEERYRQMYRIIFDSDTSPSPCQPP